MSTLQVPNHGDNNAKMQMEYGPRGAVLTLTNPGAEKALCNMELSAAALCEMLLCIIAQRGDGTRRYALPLGNLLAVLARDPQPK